MYNFSILVKLEAKAGKEHEVEEFLKAALPLALAEVGTTSWFAFKIGPSTFGIFDTFASEDGRKAHLSGEVAKALFSKVDELFARPPEVELPEILAAKAPSSSLS